jgi:hypothetical protein
MNWNWTEYFDRIDDISVVRGCIENQSDYLNDFVSIKFISKNPKNLIYGEWSGKFFELKFEAQLISIDKKFLERFLNDYITEKDFKRNNKGVYYVNYGYMLELHLASQVSSASFKRMIDLLDEKVEKYTLNIEGQKVINSKKDLHDYILDKYPSTKNN